VTHNATERKSFPGDVVRQLLEYAQHPILIEMTLAKVRIGGGP
jgi:hypothetical protein